MKISVLTDNIQKKLLLLNHAISSRAQLPILSYFLLETKHEKLSIHATDLEIGIEVQIPITVEEEGSTTVPAKLFSELINSLSQEKITLQTENNALIIQSKKTKSVLQTMNKDEFPVLFEEKGNGLFHSEPSLLQKDLSKVIFAASVETTRPALSGILIKKTASNCTFVATDGYRLSLKENKAGDTEEKEEKQLLVPSRVMREVLSLKEEGDIVLYISEKNNQVIFSQEDVLLIGRLIEADFPNYQKIIPQDSSAKVFFEREELYKAVKTCAIFARETGNIIKLSLQKEKIIVSAKTPSLGENTVEVEAKTEGEENEIAFNGKYLLDVLSHIEENDLVFEMTGPLNPGVFKIVNDSTFLHLIMPIRTQG